MLLAVTVRSPTEWNQLRSILHSHKIKALDDQALQRPRPNYLNGTWLGNIVICNGLSYGVVRKIEEPNDIKEVSLQGLYAELQQFR